MCLRHQFSEWIHLYESKAPSGNSALNFLWDPIHLQELHLLLPSILLKPQRVEISLKQKEPRDVLS